ncbi:unnamed protein product [Urochloa humidicola]
MARGQKDDGIRSPSPPLPLAAGRCEAPAAASPLENTEAGRSISVDIQKLCPITVSRLHHINWRTVELHWGKHHHAYVEGLNKQLATSPLYGYTLDELITMQHR